MFMSFFGVHADNSGEPACTKLDLTHKIEFSGGRKNVLLAATDIDDDGYVDDFAILANTKVDIRLYFYKLVYENGTFKLKRHGNNEYKLYTTSEPYGQWFNEDASSELITGDFDGDGRYEVAAVYKTLKRVKDEGSAFFNNGFLLGDVCVNILKWDFNKGAFETKSSTKTYSDHSLEMTGFFDSMGEPWNQEQWCGIAGLRTVAADLDGDGKDEIVTLLMGYWYWSAWDPSWKVWDGAQYKLYLYPYVTVWSCNRGQ